MIRESAHPPTPTHSLIHTHTHTIRKRDITRKVRQVNERTQDLIGKTIYLSAITIKHISLASVMIQFILH